MLGLTLALGLAGAISAAPIDIEADQVDKNLERVEARGGVVMTGQDLLVRAEYVVYDRQSQDVWATGHCYLKDKNSECTAATIYYNTQRGDLYLEAGSVTVLNQPLRITGQTIRRYGYDYYSGQNLTYTHCLSDEPAWSLQADSIEVPLEGFATAKGAKFRLGRVPLIEVPYLLYPAKLKRQSGVLIPEFGSSSDAGGYFGLPLYLVIDQSRDLTITPYYLQKRGGLIAGEYRYRRDYQNQGQLYFEALAGDREGGEPLRGGIKSLKADDRWLAVASHSGPRLNYDINLVSTEDYFRDIGTFYSKNGTDAAWSSSTSELISRFQYGASSHGFYAGVSAQYKQDLEQQGNHDTLQELPRLKLRMAQKSVTGTPLKVSAEASTVKVVSRDNAQALKDSATSEVSLPLNLAPYVSLRPYLQLSYRDTHLSDNDYGYKDYADDGSYTYVAAKRHARDDYAEQWLRRGLSLTTTLYSPRFLGGYYHQLVPSLDYSFFSRLGYNFDAGDPAQPVYPELLSDDDWDKQDMLGFALNNYIRNSKGDAVAELNLSRNYDRLKAQWANLKTTLKFKPSKFVSIEHTSELGRQHREAALTAVYGEDLLGTALYSYLSANPTEDVYSSKRRLALVAHSTTARYSDERGDEIWLTSDYDHSDATRLLGMGSKAILTDSIDARFEFQHDYKKKTSEYVKYGLRYRAQCWSVDLLCDIEPRDEYYYRSDLMTWLADSTASTPRAVIPRETTISLKFNLLGIGDVLSPKYRR